MASGLGPDASRRVVERPDPLLRDGPLRRRRMRGHDGALVPLRRR
jgi:hypothetical protein